MKIEQLIVQHLYAHKNVTLQGIGTFYLDPSVSLPAENEKDADLPPDAIRFEYNLRAGEDEELIQYIIRQTRKIRPLAASDLESYSMLARQFINIGKPLNIEGIGTISKNQEGTYAFTQGHFAPPRLEDRPRELKEKTEEHISFESEPPKPEGSKKFLLVAAILLILGMSGLAVYYYLFMNPQQQEAVQAPDNTGAQADTVQVTDTLVRSQVPDSLPASVPVITDSAGFRVNLKTYSNMAAADKRFNQLQLLRHNVVKDIIDSSNIRLLMHFRRPLADTGRVRDSLKRYFGGEPKVLIP